MSETPYAPFLYQLSHIYLYIFIIIAIVVIVIIVVIIIVIIIIIIIIMGALDPSNIYSYISMGTDL